MRNRVLAVLIAVTLIIGAILVRAAIDDGGGDADDGPATTGTIGPAGAVLCITELETACRAAFDDVEIEDAGDTIERLSTDGDLPATWITFDPLPELLNARRQANGHTTFSATEPVASSRLVFVTRTAVADELTTDCEGSVTWRCLVGSGLKVGHDIPTNSAQGAIIFSWASASLAGSTTFDPNDMRGDIRRLEDRIPPSVFENSRQTALEQLIVLQGLLDVIGTTEAEYTDLVGDDPRFMVVYPGDMANAQVVAASTGTAADLEPLAAELVTSGWTAPPAESGPLPSPGLVDALCFSVWPEEHR